MCSGYVRNYHVLLNMALVIFNRIFPNQHCTAEPLEYSSLATGKCIDMGGYYVSYDCTNGTCLTVMPYVGPVYRVYVRG